MKCKFYIVNEAGSFINDGIISMLRQGGGADEQRTVNYPAVEVKKPSLAGTFLDQKLCFDCRKNSHNIFPLLSCGSELLHRFAFSFCCKI